MAQEYRIEPHTYSARDGTKLAATVFRPGETDDMPAPVLLQRTPYGTPSFPSDPFAVAALDAGYPVVIADTRGRGKSSGAFRPWVHEASDGAQTVEWVAERAWCDGSVGMYGGSSAATTQLMAATERPLGLCAIAPQFAPSDIFGSDFFQDGAMSVLTLLSWSFGWIAPDTIDRLRRIGRLDAATAGAATEACYDALESIRKLATSRPLRTVPSRVFVDVPLPDDVSPDRLVPHWGLWLSHPTYDEFWESFDAEAHYHEMAVPGLHITGWHDLCQHGTVANYAGMRDAGDAPQFFVAGPWSHQNQSDRIGDVDFGPRADADRYDLVGVKLAFFDTFLRDDDGFTERSHVETFCISPSDGGTWVGRSDWPPPEASTVDWHLHPSDSNDAVYGLQTTAPTDTAALRFVHDPDNPVPTRGGPLCCRDATSEPGMFVHPALPDREDVLAFHSPPLAHPIELAGPVEVRLTISSSRPETDVTAKLLHITDNCAYNLADGIRRVEIGGEGPVTARIRLWDVNHRINTGDRVGLFVASSNSPRFDPHPGFSHPWQASESRRAIQTVHLGPDTESWLTVHVID